MSTERNQTQPEEIPYYETYYFKKAQSIADEYFSPISEEMSNADHLLNATRIPGLSEYIAERLAQEEKSNNWPLRDEDIKDKIDEAAASGTFFLPEAPQERKRWYKLLYMVASIKERFDVENMVLFEDALPDEALTEPRKFLPGSELYNFARYTNKLRNKTNKTKNKTSHTA